MNFKPVCGMEERNETIWQQLLLVRDLDGDKDGGGRERPEGYLGTAEVSMQKLSSSLRKMT